MIRLVSYHKQWKGDTSQEEPIPPRTEAAMFPFVYLGNIWNYDCPATEIDAFQLDSNTNHLSLAITTRNNSFIRHTGNLSEISEVYRISNRHLTDITDSYPSN